MRIIRGTHDADNADADAGVEGLRRVYLFWLVEMKACRGFFFYTINL